MSESEGMNIFMLCERDHLVDFQKVVLIHIATNRQDSINFTPQTALISLILTTSLIATVHIFYYFWFLWESPTTDGTQITMLQLSIFQL